MFKDKIPLFLASYISLVPLFIMPTIVLSRMERKCSTWFKKLKIDKKKINPSHAAIKILINATAAGFICKNIFPTPVQVKKKL